MMDGSISNKSMAQSAINDINYGVAELIDIRMDIAEKCSKVFGAFSQRGDRPETSYNTILEVANEESPAVFYRKEDEVLFNKNGRVKVVSDENNTCEEILMSPNTSDITTPMFSEEMKE